MEVTNTRDHFFVDVSLPIMRSMRFRDHYFPPETLLEKFEKYYARVKSPEMKKQLQCFVDIIQLGIENNVYIIDILRNSKASHHHYYTVTLSFCFCSCEDSISFLKRLDSITI